MDIDSNRTAVSRLLQLQKRRSLRAKTSQYKPTCNAREANIRELTDGRLSKGLRGGAESRHITGVQILEKATTRAQVVRPGIGTQS